MAAGEKLSDEANREVNKLIAIFGSVCQQIDADPNNVILAMLEMTCLLVAKKNENNEESYKKDMHLILVAFNNLYQDLFKKFQLMQIKIAAMAMMHPEGAAGFFRDNSPVVVIEGVSMQDVKNQLNAKMGEQVIQMPPVPKNKMH